MNFKLTDSCRRFIKLATKAMLDGEAAMRPDGTLLTDIEMADLSKGGMKPMRKKKK